MPCRWAARSRSGMIVASSWPMISSRPRPNVRSAARFQSITTPDASIEMNASWAVSRIERVKTGPDVTSPRRSPPATLRAGIG